LDVDGRCLLREARRGGRERGMAQSCREKNPRTLRERVAEWDACHRLVERTSHGTFEGKRAGAGEVKWGVWDK